MRVARVREAGAAELRCSRRRITSASTPHRSGSAPRTARAQARAAARRPPCDITWRYAHRRAVTALALHRRRSCLAQAPRPRAAVRCAALHRITHVMSPVGVLCTGPALKHCGIVCPCSRTSTPISACAQPRCVCAHVGLRVVARVARGNAPRLRHQRCHALCV